jgi:hypothetical protein
MDNELALFQAAQKVTDEVLGKGTYKRINHFDPSKGETHQKETPKHKKRTRTRTV